MQVVEVKKEEEWLVRIPIKPLSSSPSNIFTETLNVAGIFPPLGTWVRRLIVKIEALIKTDASIENKAANERGSSVAARFKDTGKSHRVRGQLLTVVFDSVYERIG